MAFSPLSYHKTNFRPTTICESDSLLTHREAVDPPSPSTILIIQSLMWTTGLSLSQANLNISTSLGERLASSSAICWMLFVFLPSYCYNYFLLSYSYQLLHDSVDIANGITLICLLV